MSRTGERSMKCRIEECPREAKRRVWCWIRLLTRDVKREMDLCDECAALVEKPPHHTIMGVSKNMDDPTSV